MVTAGVAGVATGPFPAGGGLGVVGPPLKTPSSRDGTPSTAPATSLPHWSTCLGTPFSAPGMSPRVLATELAALSISCDPLLAHDSATAGIPLTAPSTSWRNPISTQSCEGVQPS